MLCGAGVVEKIQPMRTVIRTDLKVPVYINNKVRSREWRGRWECQGACCSGAGGCSGPVAVAGAQRSQEWVVLWARRPCLLVSTCPSAQAPPFVARLAIKGAHPAGSSCVCLCGSVVVVVVGGEGKKREGTSCCPPPGQDVASLLIVNESQLRRSGVKSGNAMLDSEFIVRCAPTLPAVVCGFQFFRGKGHIDSQHC